MQNSLLFQLYLLLSLIKTCYLIHGISCSAFEQKVEQMFGFCSNIFE